MTPEDHHTVHDAVFSNSYVPLLPPGHAFGLQTSTMQFRSMNRMPSIALDFLHNTRSSRHDHDNDCAIYSYLQDSGVTMLSLRNLSSQAGYCVPLPRSVPLSMSLDEAMTRRRSCRQYTGDIMCLEELTTLIRVGFGMTEDQMVDTSNGGKLALTMRHVSSAGALYPIDAFIVPINVQSLSNRVYRYCPATDGLLIKGDHITQQKILGAMTVPDHVLSIARANALLLLVAHPWRTMRKYGDRGLRFVFLEAGAIAQNIHLAAAAIGVASVDCASIYDDEVHAALCLDGSHQVLVHAIVIGTPGVSL